MKTTKIPDFFTENTFAEDILRFLEDTFPDFSHNRREYEKAMEKLSGPLGASAVQAEKDAIGQQLNAVMLFSGALGAKANWDYFQDPVAKCFLDADAHTYLRSTTVQELPDYKNAQNIRDRFYKRLDADQMELYDAVTVYVCHAETAGAYLAHYFGYLSGEKLYRQVVPGYHPTPELTLRYQRLLETYFGKRFLPQG